jgi:hypothetical protein
VTTFPARPEPAVPRPGDLATLRQQYPSWRFGTVWASAATDPQARRLWATRNGVLLTAWTAAELKLKIAVEGRYSS